MTSQNNKQNPLTMALIFGVICLGVGISHFMFSNCKTTLTCDRLNQYSGTCQIIHKKFIGSEAIVFPITELKEAYVEEDFDDNGYIYAVILKTDKGEMKLHDSYTFDKNEKDVLAQQINNFIKNTAVKDLKVEQEENTGVNVLAGAFMFFGIVFLIIGGSSFLPRN